jgi:glycine reductase
VFCGDGYMATHAEQAAAEVAELIRGAAPDVVVAGPSFGSGRYGLACGAVCVAVQERGLPAVAGMYEESPGAEGFRGRVTIVPTRETAAGMGQALPALARLALKLGRGEELASPEEDGYLARGYRENAFVAETGASRAVGLLLQKLRGEPYATEWPLPSYDRVRPPAPVGTGGRVRLALVSEGGVVPKGNPDRIPSGWSTTWAKYDVSQLDDLSSERFESIHGGFDTTVGNEDPDRLIPLDVLRELEREGRIEVHPYLYSTVGNMGSITEMRRLGKEIAAELRSAGVEAVIVGAT